MATSAKDVKARVKVDLIKALNSLAATEEGGHRSEAKIALLETELARVEAKQASLLLELKASKGEVSSLHARVGKDREDSVMPGSQSDPNGGSKSSPGCETTYWDSLICSF